jgi:hypothetical protein
MRLTSTCLYWWASQKIFTCKSSYFYYFLQSIISQWLEAWEWLFDLWEFPTVQPYVAFSDCLASHSWMSSILHLTSQKCWSISWQFRFYKLDVWHSMWLCNIYINDISKILCICINYFRQHLTWNITCGDIILKLYAKCK